MQTVSRSHFTTVKTEGAILPADLLQRVHEGTLDGMRPQDYHLAPNERLRDAISHSWNRLRGVWQSFDEARQSLDATDLGTTLTRDRWLLILFNVLGYGRLPFRGSLTVGADAADEEQRYPISHAYEGVPIHLVSFRQPLDRTEAGQTQRRRSPHSLLQEFLNRSEDALWGFVSNGLQLRLLRDNASLTRPAFLEFDLEAMMTGELFADFSLLWLIAHQSRVERQAIARPGAAKKPGTRAADEEETGDEAEAIAPPRALTAADCWLERWSGESAAQGTRALDSLRDGVQEAIEALGRGFLAHPGNDALRDRLKTGTLAGDAFYRELLRLVYRLIFLFVAEDRDLLLSPEAGPETRRRYTAFYSLGRLRALAALRRGGAHPDLYRGLRLVCDKLRDGYPPLGLPALGGYLFSERATPELDAADLTNEALLEAIRALAFTVEGGVLRPVDYRNLGAEELGSVYESLLELHPQLNAAAATFELKAAAGSERKTTGSYYTPTSLITSLLDTALRPVIADRLRGRRGAAAEAALLEIKVVDPAAGSGHFLIAAANVLAQELARVRTGDSEPSPADRRDALRDVVGRCLYGVDLNEMAVELCKVSLWLETLDPGKPLSFLDHHIRHGNSLIGATPALLREGIPDEAFTPITGDDKSYVAEWKKRNRKEREATASLPLDAAPWLRLGDFAAAVAALDDAPDDTPAAVRAKEAAWERLVRSADYENNQLLADAWCAAFVFPKHYGVDFPISENDFRDIERNPYSVARWMKEEIVRLRERYRFFHWHLAFPEVFRPGIGNREGGIGNREGKDEQTGSIVSGPGGMASGHGSGRGSIPADEGLSARGTIRNDVPDPSGGGFDPGQYRRGLRPVDEGGVHPLSADSPGIAQVAGSPPVAGRAGRPYVPHRHSTPSGSDRGSGQDAVGADPGVGEEGGIGNREGGIGNRAREATPIPDSLFPAPSSSGWTGGFDVVLGNPPWEHTELKEKEWFATREPAIAEAGTGAQRKRMIEALAKGDPALYAEFNESRREHDGISHIVRTSGRYPLCGRGRINTYAIFAELARHLTGPRGRAGIIVPSGIATDDTTKFYFQDIVETGSLVTLYDFENREKIFPAVDSRMKFCLLTLRGGESRGAGEQGGRGEAAEFVFFALSPAGLSDPERRFTLTAEEIALLNPNTRTCPIFRSKRDAELTKAIYRRVPVLIREGVGNKGIGSREENPWGITFKQGLFNMTSDSGLFRTRAELEAAGWRLVGNRFVREPGEGSGEKGIGSRDQGEGRGGPYSLFPSPHSPSYLPLYEAKMLHHFDHRWATYAGGETRDVTAKERDDPAFVVLPRYWVSGDEVVDRLGNYAKQWLTALRDITNTTNERTSIFAAVPLAGFGHTAPLVFISDHSPRISNLLVAQISSFVYDYATRQKVGGTHMSYGLIKQLPVLPPTTYNQPCPWSDHASRRESSRATYHDFLLPRVLELTYTAYDLRPFALDCGYHGPPFRWDEARRFLIRCELDAAYFHLYGIEHDDVDYIMDTFPIVRRKDEAAHGEYRTKRVILEMYDWMAERKGVGNREWGVGNREEEHATPTAYSLFPTPFLSPPPGEARAAHPWDEAWLGPALAVSEWWEEITNYELRITNKEGGASAREPGPAYQVTLPAVSLSSLPAGILADAAALRSAEVDMLFACALRFDGYRYQAATGQDLQALLAALIDQDEMPAGDEQRLAIFFLLQRGLGKWGLERATADSRYWGAFRRLYLSIHDRPIPEAYAAPDYMRTWAARYGDQAAAWAALVGRIHAATVYVDGPASVDDTRDTLAPYRAVVAEVAGALRPTVAEAVTGSPLELRPPPVKERKGAGSKGIGNREKETPTPHSLFPIPPFPAPVGPRTVRLRRAMELGKDDSAAATAELVAFLADEDSSIRWLAGSSLAQRADAAGVVAAIAAFVGGAEAERVAAARAEMGRVLEMILDIAEEEEVRSKAMEVISAL